MLFQKKLFQEDIEPRCVYCAKCAQLEEDRVLCPQKGMMGLNDSCRGFQYDPLKRVPPKPVKPDFSKLDEEDFTL